MSWWKENQKDIFYACGIASIVFYALIAVVFRISRCEFLMMGFFYWIMAHITAIEERLDG